MRRSGRAAVLAASAIAGVLSLTGCASSPSITGMWSASDGSGTKIVNEDGSCSGMYYNGATPLDIGGPMTCTLSDSETDGAYILFVSQPPNEASYSVTFDGDSMTIGNGGTEIVTLTRQ